MATESALLSGAQVIPAYVGDASAEVRATEIPEVSLEGGVHVPQELFAPKTLHDFYDALYAVESTLSVSPLGVSAGEIENACESFITGIFIESIEQSWFPADDVIAHKIDRFIRGLGLPNEYQLYEYLSRLIRASYKQKKTPDMIGQLRSETVCALNETKSIEEFEHTLYQELPPVRASYISRRLQHILQGTSLHFANGLFIQGESGIANNAPWWNDPMAETHLAKILQEYAPLPISLDRQHLAHLLLDWAFREASIVTPQREQISDNIEEPRRVITGMEEFDELRPPKKSEDASVREGYLEF